MQASSRSYRDVAVCVLSSGFKCSLLDRREGLGQPGHQQAAQVRVEVGLKNETKQQNQKPNLPAAPSQGKPPKPQPWVAVGSGWGCCCWQHPWAVQLGSCSPSFPRDSSVLAACPAGSPSSGTAAGWSGELVPLQTAVRNCRYIMGSAWILSLG